MVEISYGSRYIVPFGRRSKNLLLVVVKQIVVAIISEEDSCTSKHFNDAVNNSNCWYFSGLWAI